MTSQWDRLLKNSGTWVGSFTQLTPQGDVISDTPTEVSLTPINNNDTMYQVVRRLPPNAPPQEQVYEYRSLGRGVLFCENGAFSQGSIQWGPFSEFGAELGLIAGDRRLRLVQLFAPDQKLRQITLIRERLAGSATPERPPLTVENLIGVWEGEATTFSPDLGSPQTYATRLEVQQDCDRITQTLQIGNAPQPIQSVGLLQGSTIIFNQGSQTVQVLLLPDGASSTCPCEITPRQPLFLEVGWLIEPHLRQRLIRSYNAQGGWTTLTLVVEQKTGST